MYSYANAKGTLENNIEQIQYESYSIFHPTVIVGDRPAKRTGESVAAKVLSFFKIKRFSPVTGQQIAKAMIKVAKQKKLGKQYYKSADIIDFQ